MIEKIFAVWKPKGPTSHDIIDEIRHITGERRVGHAGTLDPLAEGMLVIGVGREATKRLKDAVAAEKEYEATVRLGMTSTTDDEEGEKTGIEKLETGKLEREEIERAVKKFVGKIEQVPPVYSAIKVRGTPAHRRTRHGEQVELKSRAVEIRSIEILDYNWPILKLRVVTGPGAYIRALARDIGTALGTGGYLAGLTRTRVGTFTRGNCIDVNKLNHD